LLVDHDERHIVSILQWVVDAQIVDKLRSTLGNEVSHGLELILGLLEVSLAGSD
jgi:hypothetical protein